MRTLIQPCAELMPASLHARTAQSLLFGVTCLLQSRVLTLTELGRSGVGDTTDKHTIKRIDRLLGNSILHEQRFNICQALAHQLLKDITQAIVLVDWTELTEKKWALTATFPIGGRSIMLHWRIVDLHHLSSPRIQGQFLQELSTIVPACCKLIVVTDAGFHAPWFKAVLKRGWDFVGRIRGLVKCRREGETAWESAKSFYPKAKLKAQDLDWFTLSKSNSIKVRLVLQRSKKKPGPKKGHLILKQKPGPKKSKRDNNLSLTAQTNHYRTGAQEPWLLATSLNRQQASRIVNIYAKRMHTETTYRDIKNSRFGWAMEHSRTRNANRLAVMLLIATLAMNIVLAAGHLAENSRLQYQSNSISNRRVLSLFRLGLAFIKRSERSWDTWNPLCILNILVKRALK